MLISNIHKSAIIIFIIMNSIHTRFSGDVFEAAQKLTAGAFWGLKPLGCALWF